MEIRNKKRWIPLLLSFPLCICGCGKGNAAQYAENECIEDTDDLGQIEFRGEEAPDVRVDLAQPEGLPLLKKVSQFTIGTGNYANIQDNARYLAALKSPSMRYPLSIQGETYSEETAKAGVDYAYDTVGNIFLNNGVPTMYWYLANVESAYNYEYGGSGDVRWNPPVLSTYAQTWETASRYIREELGYRVYYEVLNECDHSGWYNGTWQEYADIYVAAAKGVRRGDPYAEIGGLSSGGISRLLGQGRLDYFLDTVEYEEAPLDFVSYHDYFQVYEHDTQMLAAALDRSDYFNQTQMHMNEFNVYWPDDVYSEKTGDDFLKTAAAVPLIFDALEYYSRRPEVTMVHWGTFSDDSEDLDLFTAQGEPMASYYGIKTYQNMPVERVHALSARENVRVMASADDREAGVVLWNGSEAAEEVCMLLEGIPEDGGMLEVYRIDSAHASVWECGSSEYAPLESYGNVTGGQAVWRGSIPAGGTVYIRWHGADAPEKAWPDWPESLGQVVRKNYYYEDRSKNTYAEVDENTGIVYLGMGDNEEGIGRCGVVLRDGEKKVKGKVTVTGCERNAEDQRNAENQHNAEDQRSAEDQRGAGSGTIGIRIDYGTGEAVYASSVYVVLGGVEPMQEEYPWGTGRGADRVIREDGDSFILPVAKYAPDNWNGEYVLSFEIMDMGVGAAVKIEF